MARPMLRQVGRAVRATPGYPRVRRTVITRLRASTTARRMARATFRDLLDEREVAKEVRRAVRKAVRAERKAGAAALERATGELRARHASAITDLRRQHAAEQTALQDTLKARDKAHRDKLRALKADAARKEERRRRAVPAVSAGDLVAGLYLGERPLLVFDVRGVPLGTADAMIEEIAVEQVLGCGYRPMFITDLDDPSVWRRYGHLTERLPPEPGWQGVEPYTEYLAQRLESIRADLDARWYLPVAPTGLTETQRAFLRRCGR